MSASTSVLSQLESATQFIRSRTSFVPKIGLVLGSGLGSVAEAMQVEAKFSYGDIPGFHKPTVVGHSGNLLLGNLYGVPAAILQGRFHYYEGHTQDQVVLPIRTLAKLGVKLFVLTNAAGSINTRYRPGDLMFLKDHLNLTGTSPLFGPNFSELGPRFPDMTEAYCGEALTVLESAATQASVSHHSGVYAGLPGPCYETPAEIRMYRILGADAVGMSTVAESIAANHMGLKVCAISTITNLGAGLSATKLDHQEVIDLSKQTSGCVLKVLQNALPKLLHIADAVKSGGVK